MAIVGVEVRSGIITVAEAEAEAEATETMATMARQPKANPRLLSQLLKPRLKASRILLRHKSHQTGKGNSRLLSRREMLKDW